MVTVAEWIDTHPPPPSLALGADAPAADGPYRAGAGLSAIQLVGSRALILAPRSPAVRKWIRRARWAGAATWISGGAVLLAGLADGAASLIQVGLTTFAVGVYGFVFSFLDERKPSVAPPACHLTLDPHRVQVSGAVSLQVALTEIRDLDQHPSGELRVKRPRDRSGRWPTLWIGPAAERYWIAELVKVAIAEARARG
jgi:hypothetical protein